MPFAQDHVSTGASADVKKEASVDESFPRENADGTGAGRIITVLGHLHFTFQTVGAGGGTPVVELQGSNDRENWSTLATNTHAGNDSQFSTVDTAPWKYVRANKTTNGAGTVDYYLRAAGASGPF